MRSSRNRLFFFLDIWFIDSFGLCLCCCYWKAQSLDTMKIWPGHISLVAGSCCGICLGLVPLSSSCWQFLSLEKGQKWPQLQLNVLVTSPLRDAELCSCCSRSPGSPLHTDHCGACPSLLCHCIVGRGHREEATTFLEASRLLACLLELRSLPTLTFRGALAMCPAKTPL